jgi:hypothetical protein
MNGMAATWIRDTPWRQGHVLSQECVQALGLANPDAPDRTCVVVISHDCDLANDDLQTEPNVEVIIGCLPKKGSGNYFWAKAPRTLHLDAVHGDVPTVIELIATAKRLVPKSALAAFTADNTYSLSGKSLSTLRSWLAVRYNRASFPDPFVNRLSQSKVDKGLAKLIEPIGQRLSAVYFDVDGGKEIDRSDGSPYDLKIVLTYPPGDDPEQTADEVEKLEASIETLFSKKHFDPAIGVWNGIAMTTCMSISEDDLTVSKTRLLTEWRLEYMTLKADDGQLGAPS